MAETDRSEVRSSGADQSPDEDRINTPSLPLYMAGFLILLCGILAANAALTQPDIGWIVQTTLLSGSGFLFSYVCRRMQIASRILDRALAGVAVLLLACVAAGLLLPQQFLPVGADRPDLRLLAGLVWGGTFWAWALYTDNRVVGITVPAMAALGMAATIDVNTPVMVCFGAFILAVIFLLIHQNYLQNRRRADEKERALLPRRLLTAQLFQAGVCGLTVLLVGMLAIVPAQIVFSHLSLTQAIRHLAAIQPDRGVDRGVQRFSDDDNLSIGTGEAWSASADVVMRVTPSDGRPHYWRGRTYDVYTGDGWQSALENDRRDIAVGTPPAADNALRLRYALAPGLTPGDPAQPGGSPLLTAVFEVRGETRQFYYADSPRQIILDTRTTRDRSGVQVCHDGRLGLVDSRPVRFPYAVVSQPPPDLSDNGVAERLRQAGRHYPVEVRTRYLDQSSTALPEDLAFYRQSVDEALQNLPADQRTPLDEAMALRDWVSKRCIYTLTPPPLPDDTDHVRSFLDDTRKGYCDMFASSLAVLCRTAGIPARLAVGFAPGDPDGAAFNLRAEDKHAWTEVYFPGTGWIAFDATSGSTSDGTVPTASSGRGSSWLSRLHWGISADWKLVFPLVALILVIVAYVIKAEFYDLRQPRNKRGDGASRTARQKPSAIYGHPYGRLLRALSRLGLPRRPEETPAEYAARVLPLLPPLERQWDVSLPQTLVSDLTGAFSEACYADPALPPKPVQHWNSPVSEFEAAAKRVARRRLWRRLTRLHLHTKIAPAHENSI